MSRNDWHVRTAACDPAADWVENESVREALLRHVLAQPVARPHHRRGARRTAVFAVAAAVAVALAAPAFAFYDDVVRYLADEPSPPEVAEIVSQLPEELRSMDAQALIGLRTSVGARVVLFSTRGSEGECLGLVWTGTGGGRRPGGAACGDEREPRPLDVHESGQRVRSEWINLVFGQAAAGVASVVLEAEDGRVAPVALNRGYFLAELPRWPGRASLVARSADGFEVGRHRTETDGRWLPPDPVGERTVVLERRLGGRVFRLFDYPATGGRRCFGLEARIGNRASDEFRCPPRSELDGRLTTSGATRWPASDGTKPTVSVHGVTPQDAAAVRLTFADDDHATVATASGAFLYLSADPRLPVRAEAVDEEGETLAAQAVR